MRLPILLASIALAAASPVLAEIPLTTHAERTGFLQTGRYDETIALCDTFAKAYPDAVRCETFGTTPEGRPMKLLLVSRSGALDPQAAREKNLPVVQFQGGIHSGEIDGKDAGFLALRELLDGNAGSDALKHVVMLFVPVFNVDGHERFGRWNRPNQRGPEEMGWRTTAQNYNLNRDYAKAESPEMQAMLALANRWDPILTVDLHATDGAQFEHDVSIQIEPRHAGDAALARHGKALSDALLAELAKQGSLPLDFYPSFDKYDDPSSGFTESIYPPRFSTGYYWLRNRFGMLVETHSWKEYPVRVRITRNAIIATLEQAAKHGKQWLAAAKAADEAATKLGGQEMTLTYVAKDEARTVEFRGYAYTRTPSEISGSLMTRYDESTPQVWKIPLRDQLEPALVTRAPRGGYLVPPAFAAQIEQKLATHGIVSRRLEKPVAGLDAETFRADEVGFSPRSTEGHQTMTFKGEWKPEAVSFVAGALFVPMAQPKARLVAELLEPQAPDSYAAWGFFANAFERKEYMEPYVAEAVAREQLAADPALREEFAKRLEDPQFAGNPMARLDFFFRRSPSYDSRLNLYPVVRVATTPENWAEPAKITDSPAPTRTP